MDELSKAVGRDIEWVSVNGDTASLDPTLATMDGFLKQITSNVVLGGSANLTKAILRDMLKLMPDEFANDPKLRYFTNRDARIDYRDSLADRATTLGDISLLNKTETVYNDIPVDWIPEFPVNLAGDTEVLLANPDNLYVGIWRKISVKLDEDISAGVVIMVASIRFDVKVGEETATVKATDIVGS